MMETDQDNKQVKTKWWENPSAIALIIAVTASIPPITAGVSGYISSRAELQLQREMNLHDIQISYLDRALDLDKSLEYRAGILEFLTTALEKGPLRSWSRNALENIDLRIRKISELDQRLEQTVKLQTQAKRQMDQLLLSQEAKGEIRSVESIYDLAAELATIRDEIEKLSSERKGIDPTIGSVQVRIPQTNRSSGSQFAIPVNVAAFSALKFEGKGFDIKVNRGDVVRAMERGTVVYANTGLGGFERLVIIKHDEAILSAYSFNGKNLVEEQDVISRAGNIALSAGGSAHFEIRNDGIPVKGEKLQNYFRHN